MSIAGEEVSASPVLPEQQPVIRRNEGWLRRLEGSHRVLGLLEAERVF